jgi:hypothetical protein
MATYMEERLEILRAYRPAAGGRSSRSRVARTSTRPRAGRGACSGQSPFSYADLVTKMALHDAGVRRQPPERVLARLLAEQLLERGRARASA